MATATERSEPGEMIVKRVSVPIGLEELMEGLTKEVLLKKPKDIYVFASEYFARLLILREKGNYKAKPVKVVQSITKQISPKRSPRQFAVKPQPIRPTRQLSRQLSIREESPTKKTVSATTITDNRPNIRRINTRKSQNVSTIKESVSSSENSKSSSTDVKSTSNRQNRSVSNSRRSSSVIKSVQSTPRNRSQSSTRKSKSSTESENGNGKSTVKAATKAVESSLLASQVIDIDPSSKVKLGSSELSKTPLNDSRTESSNDATNNDEETLQSETNESNNCEVGSSDAMNENLKMLRDNDALVESDENTEKTEPNENKMIIDIAENSQMVACDEINDQNKANRQMEPTDQVPQPELQDNHVNAEGVDTGSKKLEPFNDSEVNSEVMNGSSKTVDNDQSVGIDKKENVEQTEDIENKVVTEILDKNIIEVKPTDEVKGEIREDRETELIDQISQMEVKNHFKNDEDDLKADGESTTGSKRADPSNDYEMDSSEVMNENLKNDNDNSVGTEKNAPIEKSESNKEKPQVEEKTDDQVIKQNQEDIEIDNRDQVHQQEVVNNHVQQEDTLHSGANEEGVDTVNTKNLEPPNSEVDSYNFMNENLKKMDDNCGSVETVEEESTNKIGSKQQILDETNSNEVKEKNEDKTEIERNDSVDQPEVVKNQTKNDMDTLQSTVNAVGVDTVDSHIDGSDELVETNKMKNTEETELNKNKVKTDDLDRPKFEEKPNDEIKEQNQEAQEAEYIDPVDQPELVEDRFINEEVTSQKEDKNYKKIEGIDTVDEATKITNINPTDNKETYEQRTKDTDEQFIDTVEPKNIYLSDEKEIEGDTKEKSNIFEQTHTSICNPIHDHQEDGTKTLEAIVDTIDDTIKLEEASNNIPIKKTKDTVEQTNELNPSRETVEKGNDQNESTTEVQTKALIELKNEPVLHTMESKNIEEVVNSAVGQPDDLNQNIDTKSVDGYNKEHIENIKKNDAIAPTEKEKEKEEESGMPNNHVETDEQITSKYNTIDESKKLSNDLEALHDSKQTKKSEETGTEEKHSDQTQKKPEENATEATIEQGKCLKEEYCISIEAEQHEAQESKDIRQNETKEENDNNIPHTDINQEDAILNQNPKIENFNENSPEKSKSVMELNTTDCKNDTQELHGVLIKNNDAEIPAGNLSNETIKLEDNQIIDEKDIGNILDEKTNATDNQTNKILNNQITENTIVEKDKQDNETTENKEEIEKTFKPDVQQTESQIDQNKQSNNIKHEDHRFPSTELSEALNKQTDENIQTEHRNQTEKNNPTIIIEEEKSQVKGDTDLNATTSIENSIQSKTNHINNIEPLTNKQLSNINEHVIDKVELMRNADNLKNVEDMKNNIVLKEVDKNMDSCETKQFDEITAAKPISDDNNSVADLNIEKQNGDEVNIDSSKKTEVDEITSAKPISNSINSVTDVNIEKQNGNEVKSDNMSKDLDKKSFDVIKSLENNIERGGIKKSELNKNLEEKKEVSINNFVGKTPFDSGNLESIRQEGCSEQDFKNVITNEEKLSDEHNNQVEIVNDSSVKNQEAKNIEKKNNNIEDPIAKDNKLIAYHERNNDKEEKKNSLETTEKGNKHEIKDSKDIEDNNITENKIHIPATHHLENVPVYNEDKSLVTLEPAAENEENHIVNKTDIDIQNDYENEKKDIESIVPPLKTLNNLNDIECEIIKKVDEESPNHFIGKREITDQIDSHSNLPSKTDKNHENEKDQSILENVGQTLKQGFVGIGKLAQDIFHKEVSEEKTENTQSNDKSQPDILAPTDKNSHDLHKTREFLETEKSKYVKHDEYDKTFLNNNDLESNETKEISRSPETICNEKAENTKNNRGLRNDVIKENTFVKSVDNCTTDTELLKLDTNQFLNKEQNNVFCSTCKTIPLSAPEQDNSSYINLETDNKASELNENDDKSNNVKLTKDQINDFLDKEQKNVFCSTCKTIPLHDGNKAIFNKETTPANEDTLRTQSSKLSKKNISGVKTPRENHVTKDRNSSKRLSNHKTKSLSHSQLIIPLQNGVNEQKPVKRSKSVDLTGQEKKIPRSRSLTSERSNSSKGKNNFSPRGSKSLNSSSTNNNNKFRQKVSPREEKPINENILKQDIKLLQININEKPKSDSSVDEQIDDSQNNQVTLQELSPRANKYDSKKEIQNVSENMNASHKKLLNKSEPKNLESEKPNNDLENDFKTVETAKPNINENDPIKEVKTNLFGNEVDQKKTPVEEIVNGYSRKKQSSALRIQSLWRGYKVRKNIFDVKKQLKRIEDSPIKSQTPKLSDADIMKAATIIQANIRGYLERKKGKIEKYPLQKLGIIDENATTSEEKGGIESKPIDATDSDHIHCPCVQSDGKIQINKEDIRNKSPNKENMDTITKPDSNQYKEEINQTKSDDELLSKESISNTNQLDLIKPNDLLPEEPTEKPGFYRSETVEEPEITKTILSPIFNQSNDSIKDDNNNSQEKELTPLEQEVKDMIYKISQSGEESVLAKDVGEVENDIKSNSNITDENRSGEKQLDLENENNIYNLIEIPDKHAENSTKDTESSKSVENRTVRNMREEENTTLNQVTKIPETHKLKTKSIEEEQNNDNKTNDLQKETISHDVVQQPDGQTSLTLPTKENNNNKSINLNEQNNQNKIDASKVDALDDHVDLIDQVQNEILNHISGSSKDEKKKFDIDLLRKELAEAAMIYKDDDNDYKKDESDELLDYLSDFEPEEDSRNDSILTSLNELPAIQEEEPELKDTSDENNSDHKAVDPVFCKIPEDCDKNKQKTVDGKDLKDLVEDMSAGITENDNQESFNMTQDQEIKDHDSSSKSSDPPDVDHIRSASSNDQHTLTSDEEGQLTDAASTSSTITVVENVASNKGQPPSPSSLSNEEVDKRQDINDEKAMPSDNGNHTAIQLSQAPAGAEAVTSQQRCGCTQASAGTARRPQSGAAAFDLQQQQSESVMDGDRRKNNAAKFGTSAGGSTIMRNIESEAATKIQAGFRGYQVRKQMRQGKDCSQKRQLRRKSSGRNITGIQQCQGKQKNAPDAEEEAAIKIQAGVRGFLVRKRQKKDIQS